VSQTDGTDVVDLGPGVDRERLIAGLRDMVRTPSENPPGNESEIARSVAATCERLGLDVSVHEGAPERPSVVARWEGGPGPTVGYCSHYDVVPVGDRSLWSVDPFGAEILDGRLHGRGSSDAKGPMAAALEAVEVLKEAGFRPAGTLELELVADEETMGFNGTGHLVERKIISPDIAIVGEPTSLRVVRAQRGACWYRITTHGIAAHGSAPERGVNAVLHMSELVLRLQETLPDISHPVLGGPTLSVGTIRGGEKVNIIPATCVAEVDRRTVPGETTDSVQETVEEAISLARERFPDLKATAEILFHSLPFEVAAEAPVVRAVATAVGDATGSPPELIGFRGASDARFLFEAGADVVLCGPGDIKLAHTARESIDLDELEKGALVYALAFARLLGER
jgi:succinyl-diaminopimelate desuccinylase